MKVGIVVSDFNKEVTRMMEVEGKNTAQQHDIEVKETLHVPGVYDTPFAVQTLFKRQDIDAVCVYGAILKGETDHDQVIGTATAKTLQELSLKFHKPLGRHAKR